MTHKPEDIINAAGELFTARPYHMVTMDDIREKAGAGKGTLYKHFKTKEDLYCRTVLTELDRLTASLRQAAALDLPPRLLLRELCDRLIVFFNDRRPLFALLRSEDLRGSQVKKTLFKQWGERRSELVHIFESVIKEGMETGIYSRVCAPGTAAVFLLAMLKSAARQQEKVSDDEAGRRELKESVLLVFENGIAKK